MKTQLLKSKILVLGLVAAAALSACGGGGGSAGTPPFGSDTPDTGTTNPVASDLLVTLSKPEITNSGSDTATVVVTAVDAQNRVLPNADVLLRADANAIITATAAQTDTTGALSGTVGIGSSKANRQIKVTAISGQVSKEVTLTVTGAKLSAVPLPASVQEGAAGKVTFTLADTNSVKIAGQSVQVTAPGLTPATATGTTDANGEFVFNYVVPMGASGTIPVSATAGGATASQDVQVRGTVITPDVTATINSASVSANPSVISINQSGTNSRAEVRALFLGADNKPVPNVRVRFDLAGDVNSIGGTFSSGQEIVLSNANGNATSAFIAGARSSPIDGVTVRACYGKTDLEMANGACPASASATLTVSAEPLGVTIGTDATIAVDGLTYVKKYVIQVVDASGASMADVNLAASLRLTRFGKGNHAFLAATATSPAGWGYQNVLICPGEDLNGNGVLEAGEDRDGDNRLEPRPSDVSVKLLHTKTRADGTAELQIQYPQNFATWASGVITVSANGVVGTEGRDDYEIDALPAPSAVIINASEMPAFRRSPYGTTLSCTDPN